MQGKIVDSDPYIVQYFRKPTAILVIVENHTKKAKTNLWNLMCSINISQQFLFIFQLQWSLCDSRVETKIYALCSNT